MALCHKAGLHAYGGGLYLRVSPKGKKTWVVRDRKHGDRQWAIGTYPSMSESQARKLAEQPQTLTTESAIKDYVSRLKVVRPEQVIWLLKDFPSIASERKDLVEILHRKAKTSPVMANRMLSRWKDFLNYCVQMGVIMENPLSIVQRKFVGGKEVAKNRTLSWAEIAEITHPILRIILCTGLRPTEALWVIRHSQTTNIPNKRTPRDGYLHSLPESRLLRYLMSVDMEIPSSHLTLSNRLRRSKATYTPHDLRRTMATRVSDLGVLPHVIEKMLGHKTQGVMGVYNHAEYWDERIAAQNVWDNKLISLWELQSLSG